MNTHTVEREIPRDPDNEPGGWDCPQEPYDWAPDWCVVCGETIEQGRLNLGATTCHDHANGRNRP